MWAHVLTTALGFWLMASPAVLGYAGAAATHHYLLGPMVATVAWVACSEATRELRRVNLLLGPALILAPLLISYDGAAAWVNGVATGTLVGLLAMVRGARRTRMGGGWTVLWRPATRSDSEGQ